HARYLIDAQVCIKGVWSSSGPCTHWLAADISKGCIRSRSKAACKRKRHQSGGVNGPGGAEQKEQKMRAKDKVLSRMQRFKRATPPRLVHAEEETRPEPAASPAETGSVPRKAPEEKQERDELVAQRLQRQLDGESESRAAVDVEGGGLFFCQLCYKDLSAMSHQLRTLHINRCLDERERGPAPPPPPPPPRPRLPECPICGRGFKSEKSRSTHLKRCSASMGVSPAELLQAVQRQTAERQNGQQVGGSRDTSESSVPARKKARRKAPRMDEDTMVALALSRSLLEQEKERERDRQEERRIQEQLSSSASVTVQGRAGAGKTRVRKRKGAPDAPPPVLLVQDTQAAQNRIQERVSALLLIPRPPTPPTPGLLPSELSTHTLLWVKSALNGETTLSEFYTAELGEFIQPWVGAENKKSPSLQATPVKRRPAAASESITTPERRRAAPPPRCPSTPSLSTPGTQALTDLVDLAEEGLTLTQYRKNDNDPAAAEPPLSGFVPEPKENPGPPMNSSVSRLCCDLASMLNNPQLSDVQLQVDSGDVYYAHSFMLYARCPLLANTVHDAGFGVQEEGFPQAQRVLLNDVSGEAVYALLQYLYTAACDLTHTPLPDVLQLASRFGLSELQQQCEQYTGNPVQDPREQNWDTSPATAEPHQSLADNQFLELLRSMWEQDDGDDEEAKREREGEDEERSRDRENKEDLVDEDELNEIYEFAATQKKMGAEAEVSTESAEELQEEEEGVQDCPDAEQGDEGNQNVEMEEARDVQPGVDVEPSLGSNKGARRSNGTEVSVDRSYNRLFSESWGEYEEPAQTQTCHLDRVNTPTTRRMSSVSEVIDLSISPPPDSGEPAGALFPETGVSPGETPDQSEAIQQDRILEITNAHRASQLPSERSNYWSKPPSTSALSKTQLDVTPSLPSSTKPNLSPPSSQRSQPELIVLSDSSDDDLPDKVASHRNSSRPPISSPSRLSLRYTQIKAKETTQVEPSPKRSNVTPDSERSRSEYVGCDSILDGSAEVSWLIPATPGPSIRTGSTQTTSSIRRTQLFPSSHSSSSSYFSDNPKMTSNCIKEPHKEHSQPSPALQKLTSHSRLSMTSHGDPVTQTNPNSTAVLCSSTPLHSETRLQRLDSLGSPLLRDSELRKEGRRPDQGGRLESLHLTLSDKSLSQLQSSQSESSGSLAKSRQYDNPDDQETSAEGKEQEDARTSKTSEGEPMEEDFCFVFDEPPIAFDDSWGLGGAVAEQGPCFSLRLETSEDQNSPPEHGEMASSPNFPSPGREAQHNLPDPGTPQDHSLPDAAMWGSWKEDVEEVENEEDVEDIEEVDALPLSQRVGGVALAKRVSQLRTPVARKTKNQAPLVPITPMPTFSDMDTPELKNRLNRYGVRPLPKKQMVLKLKEIHQYTHQLMSSGSEGETSPRNRPRPAPAAFKQPTAPPAVSPRKLQFGDDVEEKDEEDVFPASQDSNASSTAESE
ncbi:structure-specific endonuclease subunit SLX4, partial [Clarias magur]